MEKENIIALNFASNIRKKLELFNSIFLYIIYLLCKEYIIINIVVILGQGGYNMCKSDNNKNDDNKNSCKGEGEVDMMNNVMMIEKRNKDANFKKASREDVLTAIKKSHKKHKKTMSLLAK